MALATIGSRRRIRRWCSAAVTVAVSGSRAGRRDIECRCRGLLYAARATEPGQLRARRDPAFATDPVGAAGPRIQRSVAGHGDADHVHDQLPGQGSGGGDRRRRRTRRGVARTRSAPDRRDGPGHRRGRPVRHVEDDEHPGRLPRQGQRRAQLHRPGAVPAPQQRGASRSPTTSAWARPVWPRTSTAPSRATR